MTTKVYVLTNLVNGKQYVGVSHDPFKRFDEHSKNDSVIGQAIRKHGSENFSIGVLNETFETLKLACVKEIELIAKFNSQVRPYGNGYNVTSGGEGIDSETAKNVMLDYWSKMTDEEYERICGVHREVALKKVIEGTNGLQGPKSEKWKHNKAIEIKEWWETATEKQKQDRIANNRAATLKQIKDGKHPLSGTKGSQLQKDRHAKKTPERCH